MRFFTLAAIFSALLALTCNAAEPNKTSSDSGTSHGSDGEEERAGPVNDGPAPPVLPRFMIFFVPANGGRPNVEQDDVGMTFSARQFIRAIMGSEVSADPSANEGDANVGADSGNNQPDRGVADEDEDAELEEGEKEEYSAAFERIAALYFTATENGSYDSAMNAADEAKAFFDSIEKPCSFKRKFAHLHSDAHYLARSLQDRREKRRLSDESVAAVASCDIPALKRLASECIERAQRHCVMCIDHQGPMHLCAHLLMAHAKIAIENRDQEQIKSIMDEITALFEAGDMAIFHKEELEAIMEQLTATLEECSK